MFHHLRSSPSSGDGNNSCVANSISRPAYRKRRATTPLFSSWSIHRVPYTQKLRKSVLCQTSFFSRPLFRQPHEPVSLILHHESGMSQLLMMTCPGRAPLVLWSSLDQTHEDEASGGGKARVMCSELWWSPRNRPAVSCTSLEMRS